MALNFYQLHGKQYFLIKTVISRRLQPNKVDYWEGALQLLFYKLCVKMIDHSSRSTWGPVLSRSRFCV